MKKKILTILMTLTILLSVNATDNNQKSEGGGDLTLQYDLYRINKMGSNQIAIWVEDTNGNYINTIYATRFTAKGGYAKRATSLPTWVKQSKVDKMTKQEVDTISKATKKAGKITINWSCVNNKGEKLPKGDYILKIEGNIYQDNMIMYSGQFEVGGDNITVALSPTYSSESAKDFKLIENVTISYSK